MSRLNSTLRAALSAAVLCLTLAFAPTASAATTCRADLTGSERAELAALSNVSAGVTLRGARTSVNRIAQILVPKRDYRGLFPLFYRAILDDAIPALERGDFSDDAWSERISIDFVRRYLDNFNRHITGRTPTGPWKNFYNRTAKCSLSPGRVVMSALSAHLVVDFPESVLTAGSSSANKGDFFAIGDQLVGTTPRIVADIKSAYGYDLAPFFKLWFASDIFDPALGGPGQTTYYFFQGVRALAWANGLALKPYWSRPVVRASMLTEWAGMEGALDALALAGKL